MQSSRYSCYRACFALGILLVAVAHAGPGDPLVRVDGHVITRADLRLQDVPGESPEALHVRTAQALGAAIDRRLLLTKAGEALTGGESTEELLTELGNTELKQLNDRLGSRLKARRYLAERGLTVEQYKRARAEQLLIAKFLADTVLSTVNVPPARIRRYYDENIHEFRLPDRIAYRQIVLAYVSKADRQARSVEAQAILDELNAGADFGKLADKHSDERGKVPGGLHIVAVPAVVAPTSKPGKGAVLTYHQIRFDVTDAAGKAEVLRRAEQVLAELQNGADFEKLADKHSVDAKAHPGGRRVIELEAANAEWRPRVLKGVAEGKLSGVVQLSAMTFAIARLDSVKRTAAIDVPPDSPEPTLWRPPVLSGLKIGETSAVLDRSGCLVIARLESVKRASVVTFVKAQAIIRDRLRKALQQTALEQFSARLRRTAHVEYLPAGAAFRP